MRPRRILLTTWQPFGAGSIQSVQYLAEGLHARGHEVLVACPADGVLGRRLLASGVPMADFHFGRGWSVPAARRLARLIAERGFELVDAQESRDRKAAILARALFGARPALVISRRQETSTFFLENALYARAADRVIAISEGVRRSLMRHGMGAAEISVVHTGLAPGRVAARPPPETLDRLRRELELAEGLPTIGVVARRKDQETLLRALPALGRPVNVVFLGIACDAALARLERGLPAGTRVAYTGFRDDAADFYHLFDVKVLPTRAEGLSQAILEAMAADVPVITAAVGGTPEVVRHGVNGLLFPPGDAAALAARLEELLDDAAMRTRFAAEGRRTVEGAFSADAFVTRTEAVYAELLDGRA